jgi:hypothetical protein
MHSGKDRDRGGRPQDSWLCLTSSEGSFTPPGEVPPPRRGCLRPLYITSELGSTCGVWKKGQGEERRGSEAKEYKCIIKTNKQQVVICVCREVPHEIASFHNPALSSSNTQLLLHTPFTPGSIETLI